MLNLVFALFSGLVGGLTVAVMPAGNVPTASTSPACALVSVMVALCMLPLSTSAISASLSVMDTGVPFSKKVPE